MCNLIFVSTDSGRDLSANTSNEFRFLKPTGADLAGVKSLLGYPNIWYLQCRYGGCSCHFRHLSRDSHQEFGPPEDWFPEDQDDIESTAAVYDLLVDLVSQGASVDVLDFWEGELPSEPKEVTVSLAKVGRGNFRFWEGSRFELVP